MRIAVALISLLAIAAPTAGQPPAPPDQKPPFTLEGVRRAASVAGSPAEQPVEGEDLDATRPPKPVTRSAAQQQFDIQTWMPGPTIKVPRDDRFVTTSLAPMGSAWHQEFLGMTVPAYYGSPFDAMGNAERAQAVATSAAFAVASNLAIDGVGQLVKHLRKAYREAKVNKIRREIDEETAIVERLYKQKKAAESEAAAGVPVRKAPR
jgi:hypothetical protein